MGSSVCQGFRASSCHVRYNVLIDPHCQGCSSPTSFLTQPQCIFFNPFDLLCLLLFLCF